MPYVITTKRRGSYGPQYSAAEADAVSHRAVTTLEEAKRAAYDVLDTQRDTMGPEKYGKLRCVIFDWSGSGGTVGPLPDGTVIEVEAVTWQDLGWVGTTTPDAGIAAPLLDAYNARQS